MSLRDIQKQVDDWVKQHKIGYWKSHEIITRLAEEIGEVAREVNHLDGPKKKKPTENAGDLGIEIGDAIFTLVCLANSKKIDLDKAFQRVMDKCYGRDKDRYEKE